MLKEKLDIAVMQLVKIETARHLRSSYDQIIGNLVCLVKRTHKHTHTRYVDWSFSSKKN